MTQPSRGTPGRKMLPRLEMDQENRFRTNLACLMYANNIGPMQMECEARWGLHSVDRMLDEPKARDVAIIAKFFDEMEEDLLEVDFREQTMKTLQKEHLKKYWARRMAA